MRDFTKLPQDVVNSGYETAKPYLPSMLVEVAESEAPIQKSKEVAVGLVHKTVELAVCTIQKTYSTAKPYLPELISTTLESGAVKCKAIVEDPINEAKIILPTVVYDNIEWTVSTLNENVTLVRDTATSVVDKARANVIYGRDLAMEGFTVTKDRVLSIVSGKAVVDETK